MTESVLNRTVSCFANCRATEPKAVNLLAWLQTDKYRQQVEKVRQATTKEERTQLKQHLPAITVSGLFKERNHVGLTKHSSLICLDIDSQDNKHLTNFGNLKKELAKIENFAYIGLSVSGNGFYCIVPISEPEKHKEQFQAISNDLRQYGINVDQSGSDITRLRFASYDSEPYFNHQAKVYTKAQQTQQAQTAIQYHKPQLTQFPQQTQLRKTAFEVLLQQVEARRTDITQTYKAWFEIGCSLAGTFGERGRQYFHQLSQYHHEYKPTETDRQFDYCKRQQGFSINTVFHYAGLAGIHVKENLQSSKESSRGLKFTDTYKDN